MPLVLHGERADSLQRKGIACWNYLLVVSLGLAVAG